MRDSDVLILKGSEVISLLDGRERELIDSVRMAYLAYAWGDSSLPHADLLGVIREFTELALKR